ncbi:MAG: hypothetical protein LBF62_05310 [Tannerellaceae bacterium]|nr:hypothetical protein [Tannerellaceae bacterium]
MAIIEGGAFEGARKSIGNVTIRQVNGRTIISAKVSRNNSKTGKQVARRDSFTMLAKLGRFLKPVINIGFEQLKNGSKANNFSKLNTDLGNYLSEHKVKDPYPHPARILYEALTDKAFIGQVVAARGNINCKSEFVIGADGQINGLLSLSRNFMAGDTLTVALILLATFQRKETESIELATYTLGSPDIAALEHPRQFVVGKNNWPGLNTEALRYFPGEITGAVMAAIVTNNADRSTAAFTVSAIVR